MKKTVLLVMMTLLGGAPSPAILGQQTPPASAPPPSVFEERVAPPSDEYALGADSLPHPGVPAGKTFTFEMKDSKIYPGTVRTITVYVPAAYEASRPACVYVALDGLHLRVPIVFDNLIWKHAMPITIAIGVTAGSVDSAHAPNNPRFDRSFEFDSLDDRLARLLLDEVLPAVQRHPAPDGQPIRLSGNPNDRAIGGASTGGIGAFTVAWERPDAFRRVFSTIGTFVGMRGGERDYVMVRKTEPKPLRIFLQDGIHDEWGGGPEMGDWWMSNQTMERALQFAGYDVRHVWGVGTHSDKQAEAIFPDAMRWLWRGWPAAIEAAAPGNPVLKEVLDPAAGWRLAADGCAGVAIASNPQGEVFYADSHGRRIVSLDTSKEPGRCLQQGRGQGRGPALAFGPGKQIYLADTSGSGSIWSVTGEGREKSVASGVRAAGVAVRSNSDLYLTAESNAGDGELWLIRKDGKKERLEGGLRGPSGLAFSPDGAWLFVAQSRSHTGYSYRVLADGTVDSGEPFYDLYVPKWADDSGAGSVSMDVEGRAFVATRMGVQIFDRNGRVTAILPLPGGGPATSLCFGGGDLRTLYVTSGGKVYARRLRVAGSPPSATPIALPPWGAG